MQCTWNIRIMGGSRRKFLKELLLTLGCWKRLQYDSQEERIVGAYILHSMRLLIFHRASIIILLYNAYSHVVNIHGGMGE